eukprot:10418198-Alexandrium_andersonii.AAC.1
MAPAQLNELKVPSGTSPPHQQSVVVAAGRTYGGATTPCFDRNYSLELQGCLGEVPQLIVEVPERR